MTKVSVGILSSAPLMSPSPFHSVSSCKQSCYHSISVYSYCTLRLPLVVLFQSCVFPIVLLFLLFCLSLCHVFPAHLRWNSYIDTVHALQRLMFILSR